MRACFAQTACTKPACSTSHLTVPLQVSMSRTAQLVMRGQSTAGKKVTFDDEAKEFLRSCQFETKPFAELEAITFRHVKELWMKRKKSLIPRRGMGRSKW